MEKWGKNNKLHSIHSQITAGMVFLIALVVVILCVANSCFLGLFYLQSKESAMRDTFTQVNKAASEDTIEDDDFLTELEKKHATYNLSVVVLNSDGTTILSTSKDDDGFYSEFWYSVLQEVDGEESEIIESTDNYVLQRQTDRRLEEDYLVLWGTLDNGNLILIRSAVESIRESIRISNQFLVVAGCLAAFISVIVGWFVTNHITRPIESLTDLATRMTRLDFEAKYRPQKRRNEIDVLGECINTMSETLEEKIVELKQVNYDLKKDIALKEENEKAQKEFIANASHELKTPIAVIQGYAEGLQEGILENPEDRTFYCEVIRDEAQKMNHMVLSMISLNQIETGNSHLTYERFDIANMISNMLPAYRILFEQNQIQVSYENKEPVFVLADEYMVEQVISNYISNAIHYAKGAKQVEIQIVPQNNRVRVSVFNTGDNIPEEAIPHLWDKFYKVDKARTREYGGTGIGLSIVKAIMEELKQAYGVTNREDGVVFWFELEC
jgi:signal transduction histidine kinase